MMRYLDEDDELLVEDIVPEHCSALASLFREPGKMKVGFVLCLFDYHQFHVCLSVCLSVMIIYFLDQTNAHFCNKLKRQQLN